MWKILQVQIICMQKRFVKTLKRLGKYHAFYLKDETFCLVDVLENFREMCLEIYQLDPTKFI